MQKYFAEFDKDANGHLDRKELREFLNQFFHSYKIHFPVTDEYVDAVFREIDVNRSNGYVAMPNPSTSWRCSMRSKSR